MKKIWTMKKKKDAVSPVIATILMVAITVVLAAVLYVMVMGFGSNPDENPTLSLNKSTTQTAHEEKVLVASISDPQAYANIKVSIVVNGATTVCNLAVGALASPPTGYTITFVDIASDSKLSTGDYFLVVRGTASESVTFSLLWGAENSNIGSTSWTTF